MKTFKDLALLSKRYDYNINHNLRYLALARLIERYNIQEILVLGCGKGILEYTLSDEVKCVSVDIDPKGIEIAKEINLLKKNRDFIVSDIFDWIKDAKIKYDAVLISEVLEHLKNDRELVKSIYRIINPDKGLFLLSVPNRNRFVNRIYPLIGKKSKFMSEQHIREYSIEEIHNLLSACGFAIKHTEYSYFRFLKEDSMRKVIPVDSWLRSLVLKINPRWANYIITVSSPL